MKRVRSKVLVLLITMIVSWYDNSNWKVNARPYFDPDVKPLVDMKDWTEGYYRILDCFECFTAKGRMCHKTDFSSTAFDTWESNRALSFCCKNDATEEFCAPEPAPYKGNDKGYSCSMPSYEPDPAGSKFKNVLSAG